MAKGIIENNDTEDLKFDASTGEWKSKPSKTVDIIDMPLRQKLEILNELTVDACIDNLVSGKIKQNDLGSIITLLKNNKVVEEKREVSEHDVIDGLIEDKK